jgi:putative methyltransferase (TIGR04325 family)
MIEGNKIVRSVERGIYNALKDWGPPALKRIYRKLRFGECHCTYHGKFHHWEEARKFCTGYDTEIILNRIKEARLNVLEGKAVYERDAQLFDEITYTWPLLAALLWAASLNNNILNIIDFGGSLGSSFFQNRLFLSHLKLNWNIVEQPELVDFGKKYVEGDSIKFYYNIEDCIKDQVVDTIIFAGSIQYLENPYLLIEKIIDYKFRSIIFDRTPFTYDGTEFIAIQNVPARIYKGSFPIWFFSLDKFINQFLKEYEMVSDFDAGKGNIPYAELKGLIFQRKPEPPDR